jgi:hypothetical protein
VSTINAAIKAAHDSTDCYPEWTTFMPTVTTANTAPHISTYFPANFSSYKPTIIPTINAAIKATDD